VTTDLTARIAELAAQIEAQLAADETAAKAWQSPPWGEDATRWKPVGEREPRYDNGRRETLSVIDVSGRDLNWSEAIQVRWDSSGERVVHITRNDPARVLRRVKAARDLVAAILAERHAVIPGDEFYSCSQAADPDPAPGEGGPGSGCWDDERAGKPCDCGRDMRVARLLGIIASEWEAS
jgi:hypothetical protein